MYKIMATVFSLSKSNKYASKFIITIKMYLGEKMMSSLWLLFPIKNHIPKYCLVTTGFYHCFFLFLCSWIYCYQRKLNREKPSKYFLILCLKKLLENVQSYIS